MKTPRIADAMGHIDEELVGAAMSAKAAKKSTWQKWGAVAACFAVMLMAVLAFAPKMFVNEQITPGGSEAASSPAINEAASSPAINEAASSPAINEVATSPVINEANYEEKYTYCVDEGVYSAYIGGKVIAEEKLGNKIADVNLTAGWKDATGEWKSETEALRGEVYGINGVSHDVAVALKFIDKGEAVTTTHYYVIMNPAADLTPVKDYIIGSAVPNNPGDETAGEINEQFTEQYTEQITE